MRGIVQYEVYVLAQGRWSLHARYPGAQRAEAIIDASATESDTGRATKVIRDTYWPDVNENEEVTTYLSPKARSIQALTSRRKTGAPVVVQAGHVASPLAARRRAQQMAPIVRNVRLIVALGMSLFFASGCTAALSVFMHRVNGQLELEQGTITILLTVAYLLIFTSVFRRTGRAKWRLHQMIAEMWENADKPAAPKYPPRRAMGRTVRAGQQQPGLPWQSAHDRRGVRRDLEPQSVIEPPPAIEQPSSIENEEPDPMPVPSWVQKAEAEAKAKEAKQAEKKTEAELKKAAAAKKEKEAKDVGFEAPGAAESPVTFMPAALMEVPAGLALERIILRRFAVDVVMPSVLRSHRDDPVTRRGIALLLAGAVQGLNETSSVNQNGVMALLAEALRESGSKQAVIESFLGNYDASMAAETAQPLITAGAAAIKGYVDGARDIDREVQQAMSLWRYPSTARLVPVPPEFYVFSIAREESLTDSEPTAALLLHQAIVRAAVQERGGELVPHDAAGCLARFHDVTAAFAAARAVQARIAATAGPGTATVVVEGPITAPGVPEETASILERARALLTVTVDGEVVGDAMAQRMIGDEKLPAEAVPNHPDAVRITASEPPFTTAS